MWQKVLSHLALAAVCYSLQDLKIAEDKGACRVYCVRIQKARDGEIKNGKCACINFHEMSWIMQSSISPVMVEDDSEVTGNFKTLPPWKSQEADLDWILRE